VLLLVEPVAPVVYQRQCSVEIEDYDLLGDARISTPSIP